VLPLRLAWLWATIGWLGVAFAVFLTVLPTTASPVPVGGPAQHIAGYFILTLWFLGLYPRGHYPWIGLAVLAFGGLMELAQLLSPTRHPALADAARNGIGIGAAVALAYAGLGGWAQRVERWLRVAR
jgi:VanZ family protein